MIYKPKLGAWPTQQTVHITLDTKLHDVIENYSLMLQQLTCVTTQLKVILETFLQRLNDVI